MLISAKKLHGFTVNEVLYDYYGRPMYWKDVTDRIKSV